MVTLNADGSPQVSCVWVGLDGDEIVSGHLPRNQKVKNVERDSRVAISMEGAGLTEHGLPELLQRLARVYLGPDVKFPPMDDPPPGYVIRMTPERIGGSGPWTNLAV
jgi:hypothetical protein